MTTMGPPEYLGRPARELSDEELEQQGKNAHDTRNWVFLHGTADQWNARAHGSRYAPRDCRGHKVSPFERPNGLGPVAVATRPAGRGVR